jgi:hypothetical protein
MKWFKTKEQKLKELEEELTNLNTKYSNEIDSYCKIREYIFILRGFKIEDNKIFVKYVDKNTPKDYVNSAPLYYFHVAFGHTDFKKARCEFINFKEDLKRVGLKLEKL